MATATTNAKPTKVPAQAPPADIPQPFETPGVLPLAYIRPCPDNPRKTFEGIEGLAAHIGEHGLNDPLLVRPVGEGGQPDPAFDAKTGRWIGVDYYELVDGERRYRSAKLLKLAEVPVRIRAIDAATAAEVRLVTFTQKEGLRPSEEAAALARLAAGGKTADQIAAAVGKPAKYARGLLKIGRLPDWFLAMLDAKHAHRATAELVAAIPGEDARAAAAFAVATGQHWSQVETVLPKGWKKRVDELDDEDTPLTYRQTIEMIARKFQVELKSATFSRKALDLVPGVSSCDECPKRAGNNEEAREAGTRADVCLDPQCFAAKTEAAKVLMLAAAKESGKKLLPAKEADKAFSYRDELAYNAPYYKLDSKCHADERHRTFRNLLRGFLEDKQIVVALDRESRPHELIDRKLAGELLKKHYKIGTQKAAKANDSYARENRERELKAKINRVAAQKANGIVAEKLLANAGDVKLLQLVAGRLATAAGADPCRNVVKRRSLAAVESKDKYGSRFDATRGPVVAYARTLTSVRDLLGLLGEIAAAHLSQSWAHSYSSGNMGKEEAEFWKAFGVDRKALIAEATAERKQAKEAKENGKAKVRPVRDGTGAGRGSQGAGAGEGDAVPRRNEGVVPGVPKGQAGDVQARPVKPVSAATRSMKDKTNLAPEVAQKIHDDFCPKGGSAKGTGGLADAAKAAGTLPLMEIEGFPAGIIPVLAKSGIYTLADVAAAAEKQPNSMSHETKLYAAIRSIPPVTADDARAAMNAVLDHLHPGRKAARDAKPVEVPAQAPTPVLSDGQGPAALGDASAWADLIPAQAAAKIADVPRFPDDVLAALDRKGLTTVEKLMEYAIDEDNETIDDDRQSVFLFLEKLPGVKKGPAATAADAIAEYLAATFKPRACRVCGCTDADCSQCVEKTGQPCSWVEEDLCSACVEKPAKVEPDTRWRDLPVEDLEPPADVAKKLRLAKVRTIGQLATLLHSGTTFQLDAAALGELCAAVDDAAELDPTHKPLMEAATEDAAT